MASPPWESPIVCDQLETANAQFSVSWEYNMMEFNWTLYLKSTVIQPYGLATLPTAQLSANYATHPECWKALADPLWSSCLVVPGQFFFPVVFVSVSPAGK